MVQSKFNLVFLFVSYNIFSYGKKVGTVFHATGKHTVSRARPSSPSGAAAYEQYHAKYRGHTLIMYDRVGYRVYRCSCFFLYVLLQERFSDASAIGLTDGTPGMVV
jgi:hypothetical protein